MAEQFCQFAAIAHRKARLHQRADIALEVLVVASTEQHHIDARLVAHKAAGSVDDAAGAALVDQKAERIGTVGERLRHQPGGRHSRIVRCSRPGCEKMFRTANISSVPTRYCRVSGKTFCHAFWRIRSRGVDLGRMSLSAVRDQAKGRRAAGDPNLKSEASHGTDSS
jgi:hypothetical protein